MLQEVKDYLKITWNSEDVYLQNVINRGKEYLKDLTGTDIDFENEGQPKSLLLDYCRYYYNSAIEYFEDNFQKQIVRLQYKEAIRVSKEVVEDEG
ncbi:head-tail connector protein [Tissierella pigra]|uniref:head-tail connector protein n=1 Tax=Tissierella pigra TaxID=2607614 RepID=UPI001C0FB8A8|nr:head-tail connector protein [Tissierella pigra]MBU5425011.1 head-tail connector protein [Tissierella pigra]